MPEQLDEFNIPPIRKKSSVFLKKNEKKMIWRSQKEKNLAGEAGWGACCKGSE
jgi:hypothetical protein